MKEQITVRLIPGLGYVCHGILWYSLDDLVHSKRETYPGCMFRIIDADSQTCQQWRKDCEAGTAKIAA